MDLLRALFFVAALSLVVPSLPGPQIPPDPVPVPPPQNPAVAVVAPSGVVMPV